MDPVTKFASWTLVKRGFENKPVGVTAPQDGQFQRKTTGLQFALHAPRGFREEGKTQLSNIKSSIFAHHIFPRGEQTVALIQNQTTLLIPPEAFYSTCSPCTHTETYSKMQTHK